MHPLSWVEWSSPTVVELVVELVPGSYAEVYLDKKLNLRLPLVGQAS